MTVIDLGSVIVFNSLQPMKQTIPIELTVFGISIEIILLPLNASFPRDVTVISFPLFPLLQV